MNADSAIASSACHCINVRRAANAVTEYYDAMLSPSGLTLNQYSLLSNIRKIGPCSVSELARQVRLDRTTLTRNLRTLIASGLVCDSAPPGGRRSQLSLTEYGTGKTDLAKALWKEAQHGIEAVIAPDELRALTASLLKLEKLKAQILNRE